MKLKRSAVIQIERQSTLPLLKDNQVKEKRSGKLSSQRVFVLMSKSSPSYNSKKDSFCSELSDNLLAEVNNPKRFKSDVDDHDKSGDEEHMDDHEKAGHGESKESEDIEKAGHVEND